MKRTRLKQSIFRFVVDNVGITIFGFLVPLLAHLSGFFDGKEALFGAVAGVYWIPPLRDLALRLITKPSELQVSNPEAIR